MENPFPSTVIADWSCLDSTSGRNACPKCGKSRKYYCYTCYVSLPLIADKVPKVKVPLKIDIIKHPSEIDGKSTSAHAAVLAADDVVVYTYPCIPDYNPHETVLVFPCETSTSLHDLLYNLQSKHKLSDTSEKVSSSNETQVEKSKRTVLCRDAATGVGKGNRKRANNEEDESDQKSTKQAKLDLDLPIKKVVFIDSTWNQTRNIVSDERLKDLPKVELTSQTSNFWRTQEGIPKSYLSTIEAIYYFMREFHVNFINPKYNNEYDNLLFFFCFMYNKIKTAQNNGKCKKNK